MFDAGSNMVMSVHDFINDGWIDLLLEYGPHKRKKGNPGRKKENTILYLNAVCAFDIETSKIPSAICTMDVENPPKTLMAGHTMMYIWQFQIDEHFTVIGRTWDEFRMFIDTVCDAIHPYGLAVYVHHLGFEFHYISDIIPFKSEDVFVIKNRKVVRAVYRNQIEFRCSQFLTNTGLGAFLRKMNTKHQKLSGDDFDYYEYRTMDTPIDDEKLRYAVHDVLGLVEGVKKRMAMDDDNLYTIPMTSTGYVRRKAKTAMRYTPRYYVQDQLPDLHLYHLMRDAFRGGNTHANRYFTDITLRDVHSVDIKSSYPNILCTMKFPVSRFVKCNIPTAENVNRIINVNHRAAIMKIRLCNVQLKDHHWGFPYLSYSKCYFPWGNREKSKKDALQAKLLQLDNGRVLYAQELETVVTDIDYKIICEEYAFEKPEFIEVYHARYGMLPPAFRDLVKKFFSDKTELDKKDRTEEETRWYNLAKELLNALYGMCAQKSIIQRIDYVDIKNIDFDELEKIPELYQMHDDDEQALLDEHNRHAWLPYQWGVWCTAWARRHLETGLRIAYDPEKGLYPIYCDTDSVKYIGVADWDQYNSNARKLAEAAGAYAQNPSGELFHMGVYSVEETYSTFKTLGAKKYAYTYGDGRTHITIAGVNKRVGGDELDKAAASSGEHVTGLDMFEEGFTFVEAGGTESIYNDYIPEDEKYIYINGKPFEITRNIFIKPSEYTVGYSEDYRTLLAFLHTERMADKWKID